MTCKPFVLEQMMLNICICSCDKILFSKESPNFVNSQKDVSPKACCIFDFSSHHHISFFSHRSYKQLRVFTIPQTNIHDNMILLDLWEISIRIL
jgi:hypothetical protein